MFQLQVISPVVYTTWTTRTQPSLLQATMTWGQGREELCYLLRINITATLEGSFCVCLFHLSCTPTHTRVRTEEQ